MKKNWYLSLGDEIWLEYWDEIPSSTICLKFSLNKYNELLNNEIRILPIQPKPDTVLNYRRIPGTNITKFNNSQLKSIDMRKINLLKLRQRSLNIIFDYQDLNPEKFNKITKNIFLYPITNINAIKELTRVKHKKNTEIHMALVSLLYIGQIHRGSRQPYLELSKATEYSNLYIKNMIKKARKEGYLTSPVHKGISGGTLSKKCYKVLNIYSSTI